MLLFCAVDQSDETFSLLASCLTEDVVRA